MKPGMILIALGLSLPFAGCGPRHSTQGSWEYAELSYYSLSNTSGTYGAVNQQPESSTTAEVRFESADSTITSNSYSGIIEQLGGTKPKQDCSTAVLNFLDRKGWAVVTHTKVSTHSAVAPVTPVAVNIIETQVDRDAWTLKRSR